MLNGKVVVICGGLGLIGWRLSIEAVNSGSNVYVLDSAEKINHLKAGHKLSELQGSVKLKPIDLGKEATIKKTIDEIYRENGKIDSWVNAAFPRTGDWGTKFEDVPAESWRANIDNHLNGYYFCCKHAADKMRQQQAGSIVNFSSIYGIVAPDFETYSGTKMTSAAAYSAIKSGILGLTRYMASYFGPFNIRVNAVSPGGVFDNQDPQFVANYQKRCPMGRMAEPDDIVGPVMFLIDDGSKYITGHNLVVDGGWTAI